MQNQVKDFRDVLNRKWNARRRLRVLSLAAVTTVGAGAIAKADTIYWDGISGGTWSAVGNWSTLSNAATPDPAAIPGAADSAVFSISTITNTNETVNLGTGNQSAQSLQFLGTNAGTTLIQAGGANRDLTLGAGGLTVSASAGAVTLGSLTGGQIVAMRLSANQSWENNSSSLLSIVNNVSNTSGGTLVLSLNGSGSGGTTITGAIANGVGATSIVINTSGGTTTLNGASGYTGGTTVTQGNLRLGNSAALGSINSGLTVNGGVVDLAGFSPTVAALNGVGGTIYNSGGSLVSLTIGTGGGTYGGVIADHAIGGTGTVAFRSIAGTNTITGASTYSGGTTVSSGSTLKLSGSGTLGSTTGTVSVIATSTLDLGGTSQTIGNLVGSAVSGTISNSSAILSTLTIGNGDTGGGTYLGKINDGAGAIALVKTGTGTITLTPNSSSSASGGTTVKEGTLVLDGSGLATPNNVLKSNSAITFGGGTLSLVGKPSAATTQALAAPVFVANTASGIAINLNSATSMILTLGNVWSRAAGSTLAVDLSLGGAITSAPVTSGSQSATANIVGYTLVKDATATGLATVVGNSLVRYSAASTFTPGTATGSTTNYKVADGGGVGIQLTGATFAMKSLQVDSSTANNSMDLNGKTVTISSGGLLFTGTNGYVVGPSGSTTGQLGANDSELIIHQLNTGAVSINTAVSGGSGSLTKAGVGTLVLGAANNYSGGTAVTGGALIVNNSAGSGTGKGAVVVNATSTAGATLGGNGTIGGVDATYSAANLTLTGSSAGAKATLSPGSIDIAGNSSIGLLTVGSSSFNNSATLGAYSQLAVQIDTASNDRLAVFGNLSLATTSDTLLLSQIDQGASGTYTIANYSGTLTGVFDTVISHGSSYNFDTLPSYLSINYGTGSNSAITVTLVPEPATSSVVLFGAAGAMSLRRRRRFSKSLAEQFN